MFLLLTFCACLVQESPNLNPSKATDQALKAYVATDFGGQIDSIRVDQNKVTVSGSWTGPMQPELVLGELAAHESSLAVDKYQSTGPIALDKQGAFRITLPRWEAGNDRIYSRFAILQQKDSQRELASHACWATDVVQAASYSDLEPLVAKSRKGLNGIHPDPQLFPDLTELGVGHIAINLLLTSMLTFSTDGTIPHQHGQTTYHFNPSAIEQLDRLVKYASDNGIIVSAIILVPRMSGDSELKRVLNHPDAIDGHYTLANVATDDGARYYAACMRFLAERYGPPEAPHGRISHWIIHNEVDAAWVWTNAGEMTAREFMDQYVRSLRIAYYSVRSFDPNAQVFITLTHHWTEPHQPDPRRYYPSRQLLEILCDYSRVEGDFAWGLAHHPYPENLFNPRTWEDRSATDDDETRQITFKNIEVLDRWIQKPEHRYQGDQVRTLMLSEQGFHTADQSEPAQLLQAAALAYAWKKIEPLDSVVAMHYHRWIDHEGEGGLNLGLWTVRPGSTTWPQAKKVSWTVFQALGTPQESQAIEFALPMIGIDDWSDLEMLAP